MGFRRRNRDEPRVELTPMVDVVFLLLIFFMISTTFIETPGISVKLPEAGAQALPKEPEEIKVYLSREGGIYLQDQKVSLVEFRARLAEAGERAAGTTFLLLADREARHGKVVELMDAAQQAGFGKLAIATEAGSRQP
ncbi:MAG: biopolymer transporter ExbD [Desulfuromonas sp.]|uniref:ExbD/TolR family protein n=1 Tax=Desulfuromonas sp. TaxID=892 RepID=UPI000CAC4E97|nr:biopolymer transporter ExbD [Desulfuromonas sp.]PLX83368.1 MAG: biopolymer transporter ExbD [Desulfuromonas sp.]